MRWSIRGEEDKQGGRRGGGGTTSGRHTKESSKRVKDDKRKRGRGREMTKEGSFGEKLCGLVAWLIGSL